jgi:hypothetical protein
MLRRALNARLGTVGAPLSRLLRIFAAAAAGAALALLVKRVLGPMHPIPRGVAVLGVYGVTYFGVAAALGLEQSGVLVRRILRMAGIGR